MSNDNNTPSGKSRIKDLTGKRQVILTFERHGDYRHIGLQRKNVTGQEVFEAIETLIQTIADETDSPAPIVMMMVAQSMREREQRAKNEED